METFVGYPPLSSPIAPKYAKTGNKTVTKMLAESQDSRAECFAVTNHHSLHFPTQALQLTLSRLYSQGGNRLGKTSYTSLYWATIMNPSEHPMPIQTENRPLLADTLPEFAAELRQLLIEKGEAELASQVLSLAIHDRCRCGDSFCSTFYTQPKPNGAYGPGHRNIALTPDEGMLILDVVGEEIMCVEVLDREDVRGKLLAAVP
jgi:hypothetical protein